MKIIKVLLIIWISLLHFDARAQSTYITEVNKTVHTLGVQGTYYYVTFNEALTQNCLYATVYIPDNFKAIYSELLAAKISNRTLSRFDYTLSAGAGSKCNAELVELQ